ncbi:MAG: GFA family protein [Alphaproteobacteria bacterium]|nr:GFA family protein [Alphaproteobacteria bacterium]MBL6939962.1 GFA family protein [Alphaproteobacteria bacterium]MBL7098182.1 GFA family protein [Alphaproteobacteria bacterium]
MAHTARCCCGDASIAVEGDAVLNGICNCSSCKRRTGSAFGWSVYFPDSAVVAKTGAVHIYTGKDPANPYARHFCARCGTTLYWKSQNFMPEFTGIAGGCFVDDPIPDPVFSAQDSTRCAWVTLPESWPRA